MDNVRCNGREYSLAYCNFTNWGSSNCKHNADVGVDCDPPSGKCLNTVFTLSIQTDMFNSVDPDQAPQNAASDQGLHCFSLIHQILDTSTGSQICIFICYVENGKVLDVRVLRKQVNFVLFMSCSGIAWNAYAWK